MPHEGVRTRDREHHEARHHEPLRDPHRPAASKQHPLEPADEPGEPTVAVAHAFAQVGTRIHGGSRLLDLHEVEAVE